MNVEIPTDSEFDGREIDYEGILPRRVMTIKMMLDIALGSQDEAIVYLKHMKDARL